MAQAAAPAPAPAAASAVEKPLELFAPLTEYALPERVGLILTLLIAVAGLGYAGMLVGQVVGADQGTAKMREVADAVREGAWAYLMRQAKALLPLVFLITAILYFTAEVSGAVQVGRAAAFFLGAFFSWLVGFVGMSLAVRGNLRVAAAARTSYGEALQLGYRTGTITGMLTDGLGLLGGTIIFMIYGEQAYEVLLGFGFGGTLLALFMRVGGGIYTKAADVGADLVGKVEAGHPRGRPPQRRDHRRQRGRQRRRLRRHGGRHLRELRSDDRRGDDPGLRQLRPQGRDLPAPGPGHRRARLDHQHLQRQGRAPTAPATRRCTRSTAGSASARSSASSASCSWASPTCTSTTATSSTTRRPTTGSGSPTSSPPPATPRSTRGRAWPSSSPATRARSSATPSRSGRTSGSGAGWTCGRPGPA